MESLSSADPRELGDIAILGRLGEGGMGTVYFGITPDGEQVAVKTIRAHLAAQPVLRARFEREILTLGMVQGPRVSALTAAAGPDDDPQWLATEYVRGMNLADYVKEKGTVPGPLAASLGLLLIEALEEIHSAGIWHRDLKPHNIILGGDGPKVIDFGLASLAGAGPEAELTGSGDLLGTLPCLAPEQSATPKNITGAIDIYALGAVLLFASAEHYPYPRSSSAEILAAIMDEATGPDLSGVPEQLTPLVRALLEYRPENRPDLDEARAMLTGVLNEHSLTQADAQQQLVDLTYIERDTDPELPEKEPPRPARARQRMTGDPHVPGQLVAGIAEHFRQTYAKEAVF